MKLKKKQKTTCPNMSISVSVQEPGKPLRQRSASFAAGVVGSKSFDAASFAHLIEDKSVEAERTPLLEIIRLKAKKFMAATFIGRLYTNTLLVLSVLSCAQYIFQTYVSGADPHGKELLQFFSKLELCLAALFAFDWCLNLFVADHRWEQLMRFDLTLFDVMKKYSFFSLVDFATVIPIWITYYCFDEPINVEDMKDSVDVANYILHGAYTLRILRALRVHKTLNLIEDEVHRFLWQLCLSVITMILFDAAIIQYLERQYLDAKFHTWMYYMVVTICTVGYGDITPQSTVGRLTVMGFICFAIIFVPKQTNQLIEVVNRLSVWARASYKLRGNQKHVLICGELSNTSLNQFFSELFHEDHENMNLNAVILLPDPPSNEMHSVLNDPLFSLVIHYLQGSPLNETDLYRAKADQAIAIFLMGNKFSSNPDEEDAQTILRLLSIRRYISNTKMSDPLYCLQLIRPENRRHLTQGSQSDNEREVVVCLNEMKMGVIAKSCSFPGTGTMIFNLLTSFADNDDTDEVTEFRRENRDIDQSGSDHEEYGEEDDDDTGTWMSEYQKGCDWEIYTTELAEIFCGVTFSNLALKLYAKLGIVLFALRVRELRGKGTIRVLLNPENYPIPPADKYYTEAFVIAKNKAASDLSLQGNQSGADNDALSSISSALSKTAEATTTAIRRQSMAIRFGVKVDSNENSSPTNASSGWQSVLSKYETETVHNQQEAIQKQEDDELKKKFFVREKPLTLDEATIHTSVLDYHSTISGHMIIISKSLNSLYDFIRPLRAKYLGKLNYVVILYPRDLPANIWRRISVFEGILFVKGSPLEESDLRRAGIFRASQVVVFADASSNDSMNALADADAIFTYHSVRRLNEKAQILIEIVRPENVGYLDTSMSINTHDCDFKFTPHFAAGTLFTSSILDSIVCQAFYNSQIIRVLDKFISGAENLNVTKGPIGANKKKGLQGVVTSALYQISIPDNLESRTYGALFKFLGEKGILPLGLLRGVFSNMSMGAKGNKMSYVYTNPHRDTELFTCDRVFVLSPSVQTLEKLSPKDILESFHKNGPKDAKKGQEELGTLELIQEELRSISSCQQNVDKSVVNTVNDLEKKVQSILATLNEIEAQKGPTSHDTKLKKTLVQAFKSSQSTPEMK